MTIQYVIDMARTGELKNLAVKDDTAAIINYITLGMIELYKRFPIKTKEYILALSDNQDIYSLPNDCMWIVAAYDEVPEGSSAVVNVVPINEEDNPMSLNTVSWNEVQVPISVTGAYISIIYVSAPDAITVDDIEEEIDIPPQMLEALLHYIGYRAHGAVEGNIEAGNNTHYQRFEVSCGRIEQKGMLTSDDLDMSARGMKGFV